MAIDNEAGETALCGADITECLEGEITLAEALQTRADVQKSIAQLGSRLNDNAKVQEGEKPAEDPLALIKLLRAYCAAYETLVLRINRTNSQTEIDGETLTALLARRDALSLEGSIMRNFLKEASQRVDRYSKTEIKIMSTVDVTALQKQVDEKSKQLRQLDAKIQRINWTTPLI